MKTTTFMLAHFLIASAVSTSAYAIPKNTWKDQFAKQMVPAMCTTEAPLRAKGKYSEDKCKVTTEKFVSTCTAEFDAQIPNELDQKAGATYGEKIGTCVDRKVAALVEAK